MANYYEKARTNYFKVKDSVAFNSFVSLFNGEIEPVPHEADGTIALLFSEESGVPSSYYDHEAEDWVEIDFVNELAKHLTDDSIAVIEAVGSEKMRYLTGYAVAVNSQGYRLDINLSDIYGRARDFFGVKEISTASH